MSGGLPGTGMSSNSTATIKHNGASTEPGLDDAERIRRKVAELGKGNIDPTTGRPVGLPPDLADIAMRDLDTGKVRKVRAGSMRESILGQAMTYAALFGLSCSLWLKALMRGEL